MARKMYDPKPKPIEEWTTKEWEAAYNNLNAKFDGLREQLRSVLVTLHRSMARIQEILN